VAKRNNLEEGYGDESEVSRRLILRTHRLVFWGPFLHLLVGLRSAACSANQRFYEDLFSVSFSYEKNGWPVAMGSILRTEDGGKTWSRQKSGTDYTSRLFASRIPITGGLWVTGGTIVHTKDGGKTWEKQESRGPFLSDESLFLQPIGTRLTS